MPEERVLAARELRQARIQTLLASHPLVITIQANRPGWPKEDLIASYLTYRFFGLLKEHVFPAGIDTMYDDLGAFLLLGADGEAKRVKQAALSLEANDPLGRLIDIDVYSESGALSRDALGLAPRPCLVCADDARVCRRLGRHEKKQVTDAYDSLFASHLASLPLFRQLGLLAETAMWGELCRLHGFGSVTLNSNGSHRDMQLTHMLASIEQVADGIRSLTPDAMAALPALRAHGRTVERAMLEATGGINTHKGALFHLLIATAAVWSMRDQLNDEMQLKRFATKLMQAVIVLAAPLQDDLAAADTGEAPESQGLQSYLRYGHAGARQEAIRGYEQLLTRWLPRFTAVPELMPLLPEILHRTWDTTTLKRGGFGMLQTLRQMALGTSGEGDLAYLSAWCEKNELSTGGSADLITLLYYVHLIFRFRGVLQLEALD